MGLLDYLKNISEGSPEENLISLETASLAGRLWNTLQQVDGEDTQAPDACPGEDGQLLLVWDDKIKHLELEIFPGISPSFFFWDRLTDETWGLDFVEGNSVPDQVTRVLTWFNKSLS